MRDKRVYTKNIAISPEDLDYIKNLKDKTGGKKSAAGILSYIIECFKNKKQGKLF